MPVTGRFAPTPSGFLHPGNLLCAMLAYLSARSQGGRFLLRIEDLDVPRCPPALARQAVEDLLALGFTWDEPPVYQSQRTPAYEEAFAVLRASGLVYPCFCTRAQLHASAAPNRGDRMIPYSGRCRSLLPEEITQHMAVRTPAWRLVMPGDSYSFDDFMQGPQVMHPLSDAGDIILRRSDGIFAYNLAVVVDDAFSGVTEVVRGYDILTATGPQQALQKLLGYSVPVYAHIPLALNSQGQRLAKRDRSVSLSQLLRYTTPEALLGSMASACGLLEEPRPMTLESLIPLFSWDKVPREDLHLSLPGQEEAQ